MLMFEKTIRQGIENCDYMNVWKSLNNTRLQTCLPLLMASKSGKYNYWCTACQIHQVISIAEKILPRYIVRY